MWEEQVSCHCAPQILKNFQFHSKIVKSINFIPVNFSANLLSSPRYSDDAFDRFWHSFTQGFISKWVPISTSSDIDTQDINNSYKLPAQVLKTAIKPTSGYRALSFVDDIGSSSRKYFACFHFAEIELTEGEIREFVIDVNEGDYISEPIT